MKHSLRVIFVLSGLFIYTVQIKSQQFNGVADSVLLKNAHQLKYTVPDSAIQIIDFIAVKKNIHDSIIHDAYEVGGDAYWHKGNFVKSIDYYSRALVYAKKIDDVTKISRGYSNLGYLYMEIGEYDKAIENLKKSMEMALKNDLNNRYLIASTYLASVWGRLKQYDKGIEIQQKALQKLNILKDSTSIAIIQNNIASNYLRAGNLDSAEFYYEKALLIDKKMMKEKEVANSLLSLSEIYLQRNELHKSEKTVEEAIEIFKKNGTTSSLSYTILAKINAERNNFDKAKFYMNEALSMANQTNSMDLISSAYIELSKIYKKIGDLDNAFKYMELYVYLNDSIYQEESATKIAQMAVRLELSGKEKEIELLNIDKKLQQLELKNKRNQQYGLYGGLVLVLAFAGFMYNRFKITQKQKAVIEQQKAVVETAHLLLEEKNEEIIASIRYAKRIQDALLTSQNYIERNINRLKSLN